jgi:hypothetical protein
LIYFDFVDSLFLPDLLGWFSVEFIERHYPVIVYREPKIVQLGVWQGSILFFGQVVLNGLMGSRRAILCSKHRAFKNNTRLIAGDISPALLPE